MENHKFIELLLALAKALDSDLQLSEIAPRTAKKILKK